MNRTSGNQLIALPSVLPASVSRVHTKSNTIVPLSPPSHGDDDDDNKDDHDNNDSDETKTTATIAQPAYYEYNAWVLTVMLIVMSCPFLVSFPVVALIFDLNLATRTHFDDFKSNWFSAMERFSGDHGPLSVPLLILFIFVFLSIASVCSFAGVYFYWSGDISVNRSSLFMVEIVVPVVLFYIAVFTAWSMLFVARDPKLQMDEMLRSSNTERQAEIDAGYIRSSDAVFIVDEANVDSQKSYDKCKRHYLDHQRHPRYYFLGPSSNDFHRSELWLQFVGWSDGDSWTIDEKGVWKVDKNAPHRINCWRCGEGSVLKKCLQTNFECTDHMIVEPFERALHLRVLFDEAMRFAWKGPGGVAHSLGGAFFPIGFACTPLAFRLYNGHAALGASQTTEQFVMVSYIVSVLVLGTTNFTLWIKSCVDAYKAYLAEMSLSSLTRAHKQKPTWLRYLPHIDLNDLNNLLPWLRLRKVLHLRIDYMVAKDSSYTLSTIFLIGMYLVGHIAYRWATADIALDIGFLMATVMLFAIAALLCVPLWSGIRVNNLRRAQLDWLMTVKYQTSQRLHQTLLKDFKSSPTPTRQRLTLDTQVGERQDRRRLDDQFVMLGHAIELLVHKGDKQVKLFGIPITSALAQSIFFAVVTALVGAVVEVVKSVREQSVKTSN